MQHPGQLLQQELTARWYTQKVFAAMIGKKISELNELIKGKRNITVQRDILLSAIFGDPEQKRLKLQNDFDYDLVKESMQPKIQELLNKKAGIPVQTIPVPQKVAPIPSKSIPQPISKPAPQKPLPPVTNSQTTPIPPKKTKEHEVFEDF